MLLFSLTRLVRRINNLGESIDRGEVYPSGETFILNGRSEICATSMDLNLLPTFIMGEASIEMRNKAKKHWDKSTKNDHATNDKEMVMHICLYIDNSFCLSK